MTIQAANKCPPFAPQQLEQIARILGDTAEGLSGSEIDQALGNCKIPDIDPQNTKWKRLFNAFAEFQNKHQVGNHVIIVIQYVLNPVSYTQNQTLFTKRRDQLNHVLAFYGMTLGDDGRLRHTSKASTLTEAQARANNMKTELERRKAHPKVLTHCRAELLDQNAFHAVLEGIKSLTSCIRALADLDGDGSDLVTNAFLGNEPKLHINAYSTKTEKDEQKGFANLLIGLYGMIRNPLSHESKLEWPMSEQDAIDILTTVSFIHRKLDGAKPT